jgi:two-component system sensor histidine kinase/response regulator
MMVGDSACAAGATILVIDDDHYFLDLADEVLRDEGYRVLLCRDVIAGLAVLEQEHINLVILDLRFQARENGWDVLDYLHAHPVLRRLPVLVCSAAVDDLQAKQAWWRARHIAVLAKPFAIDELVEMAALMLGESSTYDDEERSQGTG